MVLVPALGPVGIGGVVAMGVSTSGSAVVLPPGSRIAPHSLSGGMLLALAMNRRARGLRGLDVLRRSQDRAPPRHT
jgi:hypothetical protein